ncbi:MAG TPA: lysylphosphatidylglycerol synthase domain-containing protein [Xanthomonadales bacterium]|nr:lysylphosphatidylglycerol synthase domain-containing protein [Xanthomonadales bacterium]
MSRRERLLGNRWLRLAWRWLPVPLFALVTWLLYRQGVKMDWHAVRTALVGYRAGTLMAVIGLMLASFALYASYELLARRHLGHKLSIGRTVFIALTSYAFNLNIGTLVGGAGFRFRLYARSGLSPSTITRLVAFCITTNWMGYVVLAGTLFALGDVPIPDDWAVGAATIRATGAFLLAAALAYLGFCAFSRRRKLHVGRWHFHLPPFWMAVAQFALSLPNWLALAGMMWLLLGKQVPFALVLDAMLLSAIAGALAHVPGALGVLEAVFIAVLGDRLNLHELAAALVVYRIIYYFVPLLFALAGYGWFEWRARHGRENVPRVAVEPRTA